MLVVAGAAAQAQPTGKIFRIGFLDSSTASGSAVRWEVLRQELSKLGWIEGKNMSSSTDLPSKKMSACLSLPRNWFVLRLISSWSQGRQSALAAKKATTTIPIVMASVRTPWRAGLVASLARPEEMSRGSRV